MGLQQLLRGTEVGSESRAALGNVWSFPTSDDWPGGLVLDLEHQTFTLDGMTFGVTNLAEHRGVPTWHPAERDTEPRPQVDGYEFEVVVGELVSTWVIGMSEVTLRTAVKRESSQRMRPEATVSSLAALKRSLAGQEFFDMVEAHPGLRLETALPTRAGKR